MALWSLPWKKMFGSKSRSAKRKGRKTPQRTLQLQPLEDRVLLTIASVSISSTQNAQEGVSAGYFRLSRDDTTDALPVTFSIDTNNTTATNGADFPYLSGTDEWNPTYGSVTFPSGQATVDISVNPTGAYDDSSVEGTEQIRITLTTGSGCCGGGGYTLSSPYEATVSIADDDGTSGNYAPEVENSSKTMLEDATLAFAGSDFSSHFSDEDVGDSLQTVQITTLPTHGTLKLSGETVEVDDEIASANLGNLAYYPAADYNGFDSFQWDGSDGEEYSGSPATLSITVTAVNDAPSFTKGADQTVDEGAGAQTVTGWATAMSAGPSDESGQTLTFQITSNSNTDLFSAGPTVNASTGTLTYTPAANANGTATISLALHDDGGTSNGGVDTSSEQTFTITVNAVADVPVVTDSAKSVLEDAALTFASADFTSYFSDADAGDSLQTAKITALPSGGTLKLSGVAVIEDQEIALANLGNLSYEPPANYNGSDSFQWKGTDGTAYSALAATVSITVTAVNDAPSFTKGGNQAVDEDAGPQTVTGWATAMSAGPSNESSQTLSFPITSNSNSGPVLRGPGHRFFDRYVDLHSSRQCQRFCHDPPSAGGQRRDFQRRGGHVERADVHDHGQRGERPAGVNRQREERAGRRDAHLRVRGLHQLFQRCRCRR